MKKFSFLILIFIFSCTSLERLKLKKPTDQKPPEKISEIPSEKEEEKTYEQNQNYLETKETEKEEVTEKKIEIALFLPLSGKSKDLGNALVNSATLSLFENDINNKIELVLFDSKDNTKEVEKSFQEIVKRGIKFVIGPVFSSSIPAIEDLANDNEITVFSFSNNDEMIGKTNNNGGIFLGGILPETQISTIVNYAMDRGKINFSIIAPNNKYGKTITDYLKTFVRNRNGNFITSEFYNSNLNDVDRAVHRVINSFIISDQDKLKSKKDPTLTEFDRSYTQAILIPESGKTLSKIAQSIKKQNSQNRDFQLIGTNQWDEISTLNDRNLNNSWFPAPDNRNFHEFEKKYYNNFGKIPPRISTIAYDAVLAVTLVAKNKNNNNLTLKDFLNYSENSKLGFVGVDGLFRFLPNGIIQRNLAVLEVNAGRFNLIGLPNDKFTKY